MNVRGIEHIGITVTDLSAAEQFFINALGATALYHIVPPERPEKSIEGTKMKPLNGFPATMKVTGLVMLRLGNGCIIFHYSWDKKRGEDEILSTPANF